MRIRGTMDANPAKIQVELEGPRFVTSFTPRPEPPKPAKASVAPPSTPPVAEEPWLEPEGIPGEAGEITDEELRLMGFKNREEADAAVKGEADA